MGTATVWPETLIIGPTDGARNMPTITEIRTKGQVWTPAWVSRAMATYVLSGNPDLVHEPSVGSGSLIDWLMAVAQETGLRPAFHGGELHPDHLGDLEERVAAAGFKIDMQIGDYLAMNGSIEAIIANPPYIRHQRFDEAEKTALQNICETTIGCQIDRRTGVQTFFLLRTIARMRDGARGAFILPADVFEGVSAKTVFRRLAGVCTFDAVATFAPQATPFPGVDTNPIVLFFRKGPRASQLAWRRFLTSDETFESWVAGGFAEESVMRDIDEAVETGFSRAPRACDNGETVTLGALMTGSRGIATGANEYFLKTRAQIQAENLPLAAFSRCVGRTRDLDGDVLNIERLDALEQDGRPTHLLYLEPGDACLQDENLQAYLRSGEGEGISVLPLVSTRKPWWKMERRNASPILFAYLGRENVRFVRNMAGALPLNGFLCIEPLHGNDPESVLLLLQDPRTIAALVYEAKSYGDGAIKVEPNAIERVSIPRTMLDEYGITTGNEQLAFF